MIVTFELAIYLKVFHAAVTKISVELREVLSKVAKLAANLSEIMRKLKWFLN
jgi:hypothetical protein